MADDLDPAAEGGNDTDTSFDEADRAAQLADEAADREEAELAEPEEGQEGQDDPDDPEAADKKTREPLPPEELEKRYRQQGAALREERRNRRAMEARIRDLEAGGAQRQPQRQGEVEDDPRPDPKEDPIGWTEWMDRRIARQEERAQADQASEREQEQRREQVRQVAQQVSEYETDFRETHPDYDDAIEHLRSERIADLVATGYTEADAKVVTTREFLQISARTLVGKGDPAETFYKLAQRRGYSQDKSEATRQRLDDVKAGRENSGPLGGSRGRSSGELSLAQINRLTGAAFDKASAQYEERMRRLERGL
jgi:hypothetical protein